MAAPALLDRGGHRGVKLARLAASLLFAGLLIVNAQRCLTAIRFAIFQLCGRMRRSPPAPGLAARINCGTVIELELQAWDLKPKQGCCIDADQIEVADGTGFAVSSVGRASKFETNVID